MARSYPTKDGYTLWTYPGCTQLHRGRYQGRSIYVVGRNTEFEKLFPRAQLHEASEYAKEVLQHVESIATAEMCDQAVVDVYGNLNHAP